MTAEQGYAEPLGSRRQDRGPFLRVLGQLRPADRLASTVLLVGLLGIGIAGYLMFIHYAGIKPICAVNGGCEKVQASEFSKLAGVPVAVLGLASYLVIVATAMIRADLAKVAGCVTALSGFGFSAYLTWREVFTIHAICQWCVASGVLMTILAVLTSVRAWRL
jgi:uncharacterized membrane protein